MADGREALCCVRRAQATTADGAARRVGLPAGLLLLLSLELRSGMRWPIQQKRAPINTACPAERLSKRTNVHRMSVTIGPRQQAHAPIGGSDGGGGAAAASSRFRSTSSRSRSSSATRCRDSSAAAAFAARCFRSCGAHVGHRVVGGSRSWCPEAVRCGPHLLDELIPRNRRSLSRWVNRRTNANVTTADAAAAAAAAAGYGATAAAAAAGYGATAARRRPLLRVPFEQPGLVGRVRSVGFVQPAELNQERS